MIIDFNKTAGGGVTPEQVEQEIQSALTPYWESGETKDYVDEAVSGIDLSNYYTSGETDAAIAEAVSGLATEQYVQDALSGVDLTNYWTSAETEEAISAATAGKADAQNVTANINFQTFARWNSQGVITGQGNRVQEKSFDINGNRFKPLSFQTTDWLRIWAPQSAGTAGDILVSTGNGAPVWSAVTMPDMAAYTPTSGFSTINGSAITDGGNLVIEGGDVQAIQEQVDEIDEVVSQALVDLNERVDAISAATADFINSGDVKTVIGNYTYLKPDFDQGVLRFFRYYQNGSSTSSTLGNPSINGEKIIDGSMGKNFVLPTSADVQTAITTATQNMVTSTSVSTIWKGTQAQYDAIVTKDPNTFYIIVNN